MLFHLAEPAALLGIALAFLIGIFVHDGAQVLAARLVRDPTPLRSGRLTTGFKDRLSPFSAVAVIIVGYGWVESVPMNDVWRKRRFHVAAAVLAGPVAYALLTLAALAAFQPLGDSGLVDLGDRVTEVTVPGTFLAKLLLWMAVTFGSMLIVSLIPLPPTDGGRLLFLLGPNSPGWRNAQAKLTERNIGLAIVLALLVLPVLFVGFPSVVGQLIGPLLRGLSSIIGLNLG